MKLTLFQLIATVYAVVLLTAANVAGERYHSGRFQTIQTSTDKSDERAAGQVQRLLGSISLTQRALRGVHAECAEPEVPPSAQTLITSFKHEIRDLVTFSLVANPDQSIEALNALVNQTIASDSIGTSQSGQTESGSLGSSEAECEFGSTDSIEATHPNNDPALIAVRSSISLPCGEDNSLYIYERQSGKWRLAAADETNGYEDVSGARSDLQFSVSPRDANGRYFVVVAGYQSWCQSNWRMINYEALRPGRSADAASLLIQGSDDIFVEVDEPILIKTTADSFQINYEGEFHNDMGILTRAHVVSYKIDGNSATKVAPIALKPEDFVDEWMTLPWKAASRWSSIASLPALKQWHDYLSPAESGTSLGEVAGVTECSSEVWEVVMELDTPEKYSYPLPEKIYFTVSKKSGEYRMENGGPEGTNACHR